MNVHWSGHVTEEVTVLRNQNFVWSTIVRKTHSTLTRRPLFKIIQLIEVIIGGSGSISRCARIIRIGWNLYGAPEFPAVRIARSFRLFPKIESRHWLATVTINRTGSGCVKLICRC